jgi:hypothetical protein
MAESLNNDEVVTPEELALSNSFEIAAIVSVLERKGLLTKAEVVTEVKRLHEQINGKLSPKE